MKKNAIKLLFLMIIVLSFALTSLGDPPGPPNPGGSPVGGGGKSVGGPIDGGTCILLALAGILGGKKIYASVKNK